MSCDPSALLYLSSWIMANGYTVTMYLLPTCSNFREDKFFEALSLLIIRLRTSLMTVEFTFLEGFQSLNVLKKLDNN